MSDFGQWLRQLRLSRGIGSADLSRRAGLNRTVVSDLERRKAFPRHKTIEALADALELTGPDRDEFTRRARSAGKPQVVELLGLTIWKTLPQTLFDRRERYGAEELAFLDDAYGDGVPAVASMLAWRQLASTRLPRAAAESIRSISQDAFAAVIRAETFHSSDSYLATGGLEEVRRNAAARVHWIAAPAYRSILFSRQPNEERLVSKIESWRFFPSYRDDYEISIDLTTPVNDVTSCEGPYPCRVFRAIYDLMISREIWIRLGLSELLQVADPAIENPVQAEADLLAPDAIDGAVTAAADQAVDVLRAVADLRFALRAYVIPELGPLIAGPLAPLLDRLTRVERSAARAYEQEHGVEGEVEPREDPTPAIAAETERLLAARRPAR